MLALLIGGCRSAPPLDPPLVPSSATGSQASVDRLLAAAASGERADFDRQVSTADPALAPRLEVLFDNLSGLPITVLEAQVLGVPRPVSEARRPLLGADAWVQLVALRWRLDGEERSAEHRVPITFLPGGDGALIAALSDTLTSTEASGLPLWWLEPAEVRRSATVTVLAAQGMTQSWTDRGEIAATTVRARLSGGLGSTWSGRLVVQAPSTRQAFERVLGVPSGSYDAIAAVAWADGPNPGSAAVRIVVNPGVTTRTSEDGLRVLLAHEATHVATRSVDSPAPTWLVEGFADWVAYGAYPATSGQAARTLLEEVQASGAPTSLPSETDFEAEAAALDRAYTEAWLACRFIAESEGAPALNRFYAAVDRGTPVEVAVRDELGTDLPGLVSGWRGYLTRLAARG